MAVDRIVANIPTDRMDVSKAFYTSLFDLDVAMDMGWIATLVSPVHPTIQLSLVETAEASAPGAMTLTIQVGDVDAVHARAVDRGVAIVYPLTDEPWGVRRFHLRDPNGVVVNVMTHARAAG